jgi:peptidoglycan hydrolase CwlO-like protein
MVSEDLAKHLHDRVTRGESLSSEKQALLEEWYSLQDSAEQQILISISNEKDLANLRTQVETMLAQLTTVTQRIQEIAAENESLKREIALLQRQLQATIQPAG